MRKLLQNIKLVTVIVGLVMLGTAKGQTCKDSVEHARLQRLMWEANGVDNRKEVYRAAEAFQAHAARESDMEAYYNGWLRKIIYELDLMNIYEAYKAQQGMKEDLERVHPSKDEAFLVPNMLGQIFNQCGFTVGAIREFERAIDLMRGTRYEEHINTLYLGLAHICISENPKEALKWIMEDIREVERHPESERYHRDLANAYAFKSMVEFKMKKVDDFKVSRSLSDRYEEKNVTGSHGSFLPYTEIYGRAIQGDKEGALAAADSLSNKKDRYVVRSDIFKFVGDDRQAYQTLRQLMHYRDSITGVIIADNIEKTEAEVKAVHQKQTATRAMNITLIIAFLLALLLIAALVHNILNRRRYQMELIKKNKQLSIANERALEADRMKTEFIRNVSHEIRTPLNIINGFSQILTDTTMDMGEGERQDIANTISENTHHITSLVNKILALSSESAQDILSKCSDTLCCDVCRQAISNMPKYDPARVHFMFETGIDEQRMLHTNADCLQRMLGCLLENAVKFTEQGHIKLSVVEGNDHTMDFIVEDTGCGISEEDSKHIFERFSKGDNFKQGLGLGLAYCHETAEKLGGSLILDSTYRTGARFVLSLPEGVH